MIFNPKASKTEKNSDAILCYYVNRTSKVQVLRIANIENWYFERVVFPGQRLIFEAYASAQLEVCSGAMASAVLCDTIPCDRLQLNAFEDSPALQAS